MRNSRCVSVKPKVYEGYVAQAVFHEDMDLMGQSTKSSWSPLAAQLVSRVCFRQSIIDLHERAVLDRSSCRPQIDFPRPAHLHSRALAQVSPDAGQIWWGARTASTPHAYT